MSEKRARSLVGTAASLLVVALVVFGPLGCGNQADKPDPTEQPHDFQIEVEVTDTDGKVVPEAPVKLDGKIIGYTDKEGKFGASLREKPGTKIELAIGDVDGYRIVDKQSVTEKLELKPNLSGQGYKGVPVLLHAVAESVQRRYLVWIDATCKDSLPADACQGLLVKRGDDVVATTDRLGKAHFNLREQPQEKIAVTIDTPTSDGEDDDAPTFEPGDPTYKVTLGIDPTIYRLEPTFKDPSEESDDEDSRRVYRQRNTGSTSDSSGSSGSTGGSDSSASDGSGGSESTESSSGGGGGSSEDDKDGDDSIELF